MGKFVKVFAVLLTLVVNGKFAPNVGPTEFPIQPVGVPTNAVYFVS